MDYDVIFYKDERGRSPVADFLDDLNQQAKKSKLEKQLLQKCYYYIEILEKNGTRAGAPFTRNIGDGIWELRPKDHRILFFGWHDNKIVLLHAFRKTTKKTPQQEIEKAKREMQDWLEHGNHRTTE